MKLLFRWPKTFGVLLSFITLLAGAAAVILADFGAPPWVFLILLAWLLTMGLPTTLAVLCAAAIWGRTAMASGFLWFVVCASVLAATLQAASFMALGRLWFRQPRRQT